MLIMTSPWRDICRRNPFKRQMIYRAYHGYALICFNYYFSQYILQKYDLVGIWSEGEMI